MTDSLMTKLGDTRAGPRTRIWLQGSRLVEHGFNPGSHFRKRWDDDALVITRLDKSQFETTPREERGTVSGNATRPVIDITGQRVAVMFPGTHVRVAFIKGRIVITKE